MQTPRRLPWFALFAGLTALLSAGCSTTSSSRTGPIRSPITYAIVLYLAEGEQLDDTGRLNALSLARDTLLAAGIVTPQDQMISDLERAQQLYRARVENGVLTEIAGVPSVSNATTVVLSQPRYSSGRLFWETSYPYGYPYETYHAGFPVPGPSWGYSGYRDRRDRKERDHNRGKDRDRGDRNHQDGDRPDRPNRPDRGNHDQANAPGPRPNPHVKPEDARRMPGRPDRGDRGDRGDRVTPSPRPRPSPAPEPPRTRPAPSVPEPKWNRDHRSSSSSSTSSSSDRDKDSKRESTPSRTRKDRLN